MLDRPLRSDTHRDVSLRPRAVASEHALPTMWVRRSRACAFGRGTSARRPGAVRVLIVDDAPGFREAAKHLLERRGYTIAGEATTAADALSAVQALRPDAVLLDVNLPDGDGFELATKLIRVRPDLSVLITSTDFDDGHYARARESGAAGYVPKTLLARAELTRFWPGGRRP